MLVEERLPRCEVTLDPLQIGRTEPSRDEHRLHSEPLREPGKQLVRGNDLAPLDLAHVLLREAAVGEVDLRHAGGAAERADASGNAGRWCHVRLILHRTPTVRSFPKVAPDVLAQYGPEIGDFTCVNAILGGGHGRELWWMSGGGGIRTHGRVAPSAVFKTARFDRSRTPPAPESMHLAGRDGCSSDPPRAHARLGSDVCGEHRP